jgi:hypothetical protein
MWNHKPGHRDLGNVLQAVSDLSLAPVADFHHDPLCNPERSPIRCLDTIAVVIAHFLKVVRTDPKKKTYLRQPPNDIAQLRTVSWRPA